MDVTDFECKPRPTPSYVRFLRPMGWGDFKAKLVRCGVIDSTAEDVPTEWQEAFRNSFGRTYPMK